MAHNTCDDLTSDLTIILTPRPNQPSHCVVLDGQRPMPSVDDRVCARLAVVPAPVPGRIASASAKLHL
jgi:hypothetical protein